MKDPFDHIDWNEPENSKEIRRQFSVRIEESVARAFIKTVQSRGLFVRETVVKFMKEFVRVYGDERTREVPRRDGVGSGKDRGRNDITD